MKKLLLSLALLTPGVCRADSGFQAYLRNAGPQAEGVSVDTSAFCLNEEYFQGARPGELVAKIQGGAARKYILALKLVASKADNGSLVNKLGVYDVTSIAARRQLGDKTYCSLPVIGREFSLDLPGQTTFSFEANNSQSSYLMLKVGDDGAVSVSAQDLPDQQVATSRDQLLAARAKELEGSPEMTVGPEKFLCLVQPGATVSVAFFAADGDHKQAELLADLYAGQRGLLPAPLGEIGDASYYLDYNRKSGKVEAMPGPEPAAP